MYLLRAEFLKLRVVVIATVFVVGFVSGFFNLLTPILALTNSFGLDLSTNAIDYHPLGAALRDVDSYLNAGVLVVPAIIAAMLVAGEYGSRTIGLVVSLQGQRVNYIVAKFCIILIATAVVPIATTLLLAVIQLIVTAASGNFDTGDLSALDIFGASVVYYLKAIPIFIFYSALALMVAVLTKSRIVSIVFPIVFLTVNALAATVINLVGGAGGGWHRLLPFEWTRRWVPSEDGISAIVIDRVLSVDLEQLLFLGVLVGASVAMVGVSVWVFRRREISET